MGRAVLRGIKCQGAVRKIFQGIQVWVIYTSPPSVQHNWIAELHSASILRDRGVEQVVISDIMAFSQEQFDTVLMLMNGIGMVGTIEDLRKFLRHAHRIVTPGGQILCDSVDVSVTANPTHVAYRNQNADCPQYSRDRIEYPASGNFHGFK